jgi:hypothetical protein
VTVIDAINAPDPHPVSKDINVDALTRRDPIMIRKVQHYSFCGGSK